jgi:hypothetical protein
LRARPALKRLYSIAGRVLSVDTFDEWSTVTVSRLVESWNIRPLPDTATTPDAILKISSENVPPQIPPDLTNFEISDGAICHWNSTASYLDFNKSLVAMGSANEVTVWIDQPQKLESALLARILSQAFSAAWRRCGLFEFHSGGVVPPNETAALLIAGASGTGKSTITAQLAASGWSYLSDDTLLLKEAALGVEAVALREFFALTPTTVSALPLIQRTRQGTSEKERFAPQELFSSQQLESAKPAVVLFPIITGEPDSRLERLAASATMSRLLKLCPWSCYDSVSAGNHLTVLGRLARKAAGFDILAGTDLLRDPQHTVDLAYRAFARN